MFEFRAIHNENKTLKSVTRVRVVDEKAKLDGARHIFFEFEMSGNTFFELFTECYGAKLKHLKLSVHHHLCRESVF